MPDKPRKPRVIRPEAIREKRLALGLSVTDAARQAWGPGETGRVGWQRLEECKDDERKDPRVSTIRAVARVLKCRIEDLLEKE